MTIRNCNNCGVQVEETARFCRNCGQPVSPPDSGPRGYASPTDYEAPTRPMNAGFTTPSYYPQSPVPLAPVSSTNNLEQGKSTRTLFMVGGVVGAILLTILLTVIFTVWTMSDTGSPPDEAAVTSPRE